MPGDRGTIAALILACLACSCGEAEEAACRGVPSPCETFATPAECSTQAGCANRSSCGGTATACSILRYDTICAAQPECRWGTGCMGLTYRCRDFPTEDGCHRSLGCTWDPAAGRCTGTAQPCFTFSIEDCVDQLGCTVGESCEGEATACGNYTAEPACLDHFGCQWNVGPCAGMPVPCGDLPVDLCPWQWGCEAL